MATKEKSTAAEEITPVEENLPIEKEARTINVNFFGYKQYEVEPTKHQEIVFKEEPCGCQKKYESIDNVFERIRNRQGDEHDYQIANLHYQQTQCHQQEIIKTYSLFTYLMVSLIAIAIIFSMSLLFRGKIKFN